MERYINLNFLSLCMLKTVLRIHHKSCWGSEINLRFPMHKFSSIDCRWIKGKVAHIVLAAGNSSYFDKIMKYLKDRRDVKSVELLSRTNSEMYVRVITEKDKRYTQFSDIFFKDNCFPVAPTRFEDKYEIWTLGTSEKKNIANIYTFLKKKYPVKLKSVIDETIAPKLTGKQREIILQAKYFGYYNWPRKKSATDIAEMLKIPKTVFLSHLRKAESKIITGFLS